MFVVLARIAVACRRAEPQHREYRSPKSDASHHAEVHGEVNWRTPGRERRGRKRMTTRRIERGREGGGG